MEITNPMYLGDTDDPPAFVHDDDKVHFGNPVYESMYAGGNGSGGGGGSSNSNMLNSHGHNNSDITLQSNGCAPEEKKGLLQKDDINQQDMI